MFEPDSPTATSTWNALAKGGVVASRPALFFRTSRATPPSDKPAPEELTPITSAIAKDARCFERGLELRAIVAVESSVTWWHGFKGERKTDGVRATMASAEAARAFVEALVADWRAAEFGEPRAIAAFDRISPTQVVSLARDIAKRQDAMFGGGLASTRDTFVKLGGEEARFPAFLWHLAAERILPVVEADPSRPSAGEFIRWMCSEPEIPSPEVVRRWFDSLPDPGLLERWTQLVPLFVHLTHRAPQVAHALGPPGTDKELLVAMGRRLAGEALDVALAARALRHLGEVWLLAEDPRCPDLPVVEDGQIRLLVASTFRGFATLRSMFGTDEAWRAALTTLVAEPRSWNDRRVATFREASTP